MTGADGRLPRSLLPLLVTSAVVVLVTTGLSRGWWISNLHNCLLATAFTAVGAYVSLQRPGHRTGVLFLSTGAVEAVLFLGRQVGHFPGGDDSTWLPWLAWLGVWPVALALGLVTVSVICFPDGHPPTPPWRVVTWAVVVVAISCSLVSALWPVEYAATGLATPHPLHDSTPGPVDAVWTAVAHPSYAVMQALWVVALVRRWHGSTDLVRRQVAWLAGAAVVSVVALGVGLAGWHTPTPGLLTAALLPVAAGYAIVHGQHLAAYSALTWLSRSGAGSAGLPHDLARAAAQALQAPRGTLWLGDESELCAVGVWPETSEEIAPAGALALRDARDIHVREVERDGRVLGALTVERPATDPLSKAEARLLDDLAGQAALVLEHLHLAGAVAEQRRGRLGGLTPREQDVLELMAQGLSNAAICQRLHLSVKTVEPLVSAIFAKLHLPPDADSNRRVLAVVAYLRRHDTSSSG